MEHRCDCGSSHESTEHGLQYNLYQKIDKDNVECLNEYEEGSGVKVFKAWEERLSDEKATKYFPHFLILVSTVMAQIIAVTLILLCMSQYEAMVAYDCGSNSMNITTVSLLKVGECNLPEVPPIVSKVHIQLLQLSHFKNTRVQQCKVEIDRTVLHCGMHSHMSLVDLGRIEYIMDVTREECAKIHATKALALGFNTHITGLQINATSRVSATLAGTISNSGDCSGVQYADHYGAWTNVVVQALVKVTLYEYYAQVQLSSHSIILRTGIRCDLPGGSCMDTEGGYTFWDSVPSDSCSFSEYDILFEGIASKLHDNTSSTDTSFQDVYTLSSRDITFSFTREGRELLCGYELIKTEHPKLFITELPAGESFVKKNPIATENLDIFAYVNSKFVYVEKHIRTQLKMLYRDVLHQRCLLKTDVLKNTLTLATLSPDEFAYNVMKGPGYMAVTAGEVVHIIKCVPVEIKVRITDECYQNLPVFRGNESMFIFPKTHVLVKKAVQVDCNPFIPSMYHVNEQWYKMLPHPTESKDPTIMQPLDAPTWKYSNPGSLATSGIYSIEDLNKLNNRIMFPAERPAILNTLARASTGQNTVKQGVSISHLLDEDMLQGIVETMWGRLWGWVTGFGSLSAGVIGFIMLARVIKFSVDTFIHGYALHTVYGWSIHLIGAIWDSVTHLLLHLSKGDDDPKITEPIDIEAQKPSAIPTAPTVSRVYPPLDMHNEQYYSKHNRSSSACSCAPCQSIEDP